MLFLFLAWGNLANVWNSQKKTDKAEEAYRQALTYRRNMADVHYNLYVLLLLIVGARCSSVVRAFAYGAMGRRIDP